MPSLQNALEYWHTLEVPYEVARTQVLVGRASRALGDEQGARSEWAAARETFMELGAAPDLERLETTIAERAGRDAHGLSDREFEVLRHVAAGRRNREIADALVISHRTVERYVSNISPNSRCRRGRQPRPTPASTTWSEPIATRGWEPPSTVVGDLDVVTEVVVGRSVP